MPFLVRVTEGDDPREIAENVDDVTANDLATKVSAATGETVEIVPYHYDEKTSSWVLAAAPSTVIAAKPDAAVEDGDESLDLEEMKGDDLDKLAAEKNVEGYKKSATVDERRSLLKRVLGKA